MFAAMSATRELRRRLQADRALASFEPCLPRSANEPPAGPGWIHEIKHDGFRILAHRRGRSIRLVTRNGHDLADRFPLAAEAIEVLPNRSCVIDGEAIVCDDSGLAVFDLIRGHGTSARAILCAFDLLEVNGEDIRGEPIEDRKRRLAGAPARRHRHQRALRWRRRDHLQARLRTRLRGHRFEAARVAVPRRSLRPLAQDKEPGGAGREARG
jgi:ATP-dependent DNA ligase